MKKPADLKPFRYDRFSEGQYFAPFGRYEGTHPAEEPADEVLVGREGKRAFFLNLLFASGRRGAYLITGYRGSGKSTFVRYVLNQYVDNVYRRYLRRNVGKRLLWDRLGLFALIMVLVSGGLILSELLQALALERSKDPVVWGAIVVIAVTLLYPLRLAAEALRLMILDHFIEAKMKLRLLGQRGRWLSKPEIGGGLAGIGVALMAFLLGPLTHPAVALGQLATVLGFLYLIVTGLSFSVRPVTGGERDPESLKDEESEHPLYELAQKPEQWTFVARRLPWLTTLALLASTPLWPLPVQGSPTWTYTLVYWLLGIIAFVGATLLKGIDALVLARALASGAGEEDARNFKAKKVTGDLGLWTLISSLTASSVVLLSYILLPELRALPRFFAFFCLGLVALTAISGLMRWGRFRLLRRQSSERVCFKLHPRPRVLLFFKAFILIVFFLQLGYPIFHLLVDLFPPLLALLGRIKDPSVVLQNLLAPFPSLLAALSSLLAAFRDFLAPYPSLLEALSVPAGSLCDALCTDPRPALFTSAVDEITWILGAGLLLLVVASLEYEWTIQPFAKMFDDKSLHAKSLDRFEREASDGDARLVRQTRYRRYVKELARQTFFWRVYRNWLPVLNVNVNLGLQELDHGKVIEAMLAGLESAYRRTFVNWSNPLTAFRRGVIVSLVLVGSILFADRWFRLPEGMENVPIVSEEAFCPTPDFEGSRALSPPLRVACAVGGDTLVGLLYWSPGAQRTEPEALAREAAARNLYLDEAEGPLLITRLAGMTRYGPSVVHPRLYQILVFLVFLLVSVRVGRWLAIPPYRRMLREMRTVRQSLSSKTREEDRPDASKLTQILNAIRGRETVRSAEGGPFDPVTVELAFLEILAKIQDPSLQFPLLLNNRINPPLPEVIFIFDELDKIEIPGSAALDREGADAITDVYDQERQRSVALHRLFADLKNLLCSEAARFIFIGGRNLRDEWLADQSGRRPILSNIFNAEIYLGSLLTETAAGRSPEEALFAIRDYLELHLRRANSLHGRSQKLRYRPWMAHWAESSSPAAFAQYLVSQETEVLEFRSSSPLRMEPWMNAKLEREFLRFLAYRSKGDIKRLNQLLEGFLRPMGRLELVSEATARAHCQHALVFRDRDLVRIQLASDVYGRLWPVLKARVDFRDDKLARGVFYLSDFILKFHRRAFAWGNLERVDELVHIHRAPDLRRVLMDIVQAWAEPYLHAIRNGMYDFRFQSGFANEIEFASRHSEEELAAFNFTLDESQALKAVYASRMQRLSFPESYEFVAGLGELHDFDEEYELGRHFYLKAIRALDDRFGFVVSRGTWKVLQEKYEGHLAARKRVTWAVSRIRLMLQIAMTFERTKDLEQAHVQYQDAHSLAAAVLDAVLAGRYGAGGLPYTIDYLSTIKHLNLLFQPAVAEAWIAEKLVSGVDTGPALLEKQLDKLRQSLPFVSPSEFRQYRELHRGLRHSLDFRSSNFSLVMAELHNKAGDLYFFKGKQLPRLDRPGDIPKPRHTKPRRDVGLLRRAAYHYALSMHEVRRFNHYRRESSGIKFRAEATVPENAREATIYGEQLSDFVYRGLAGSMFNLSDTLLATVSMRRLCDHADDSTEPLSLERVDKALTVAKRYFFDWIGGDEIGGRPSSVFRFLFPGLEFEDTTLGHWLGEETAPSEKDLISFHQTLELDRLAASVLVRLLGNEALTRGGYHYSAAREHIRIASSITQYLNLFAALVSLLTQQDRAGKQACLPAKTSRTFEPVMATLRAGKKLQFLGHLHGLARYSLDRAQEEFDLYAVGSEGQLRKRERFGLHAVQTAALGLAGLAVEERGICRLGEHQAALCEGLREDFKMKEAPEREVFRGAIYRVLTAHSFPVINRMSGLKALVDDVSLAKWHDRQSPVAAETGQENNLEELQRLDELYSRPLHFTPLQLGFSLGVHVLSGPASNGAVQLRQRAIRSLRRSQEMYTMQRGYYDSISDLYYLYDDFSDRAIHCNHALQMAAGELTVLMSECLQKKSPPADEGAGAGGPAARRDESGGEDSGRGQQRREES